MTENNAIRVLLADDHTMFRQGLKEMLSTDPAVEVVAEAGDGREALALAHSTRPDVVILDVEMPVMGGRETLDHLLKMESPPSVIVVSMYGNPRLMRELLSSGASTYLVKSASLEELLNAVYSAAQGFFENPMIALPREALDWDDAGRGLDLTPREREIVLLVTRGLSNRQIANSTHISEATVKRHLANIYAKLDVSSRGETTRKALAEGWITTWDVTGGGGGR